MSFRFGSNVDQHILRMPAGSAVSAGDDKARRWESAETNRLNKGHWKKATDTPINQDINAHQGALRTRSTYESANNPLLIGAVRTFASDVAGRNGPTLQVQSDSPAYNQAFEELWRELWEDLDYRGRMGAVDILRLWIQDLCFSGEYLAQRVRLADPPTRLATRLQCIHVRRLQTPSQFIGDSDVVMGIRQDKGGRPISYYILEPTRMGPFEIYTGAYQEIPARDIIHEFLVEDAEQSRGVPLLATSLQSIGEMRDYDGQVLDAARAAANQGVALYTEHPDAEYVEVNESVEMERQTMSTMPPGWKPFMVKPEQPMVGYVEYRHERAREIGRPINMPLMMVLLDSSNHSYSSARFDSQIYMRWIQAIQGWIERRPLLRVAREIDIEGRLARLLPPRPARVKLTFTWPRLPHVDRAKEAKAQDTKLRNGTMALSDALAEDGDGTDIETHVAKLKRDDEALVKAGFKPLRELLAEKTPLPEPPEEPEEQPKKKAGNSTPARSRKTNKDNDNA